MSYIDDVKEKIRLKKEERLEAYKQYVDDYIVPQIADSMTSSAVIGSSDIEGEGIEVAGFKEWLSSVGFNVEVTGAQSVLTISLIN